MFKVSISSNNGMISGGGEFSTEQEAQTWLNSQIGKPHRLPQREKNVSECSQEELDSALSIEGDIATLPATFTSSIVDITAQKAQEEVNNNARKLLAESDWKVLRHRDQLDAGITTSLSNEQYQELLSQRQAARNSIVE